jgi:gliding motility-associated-like protein
MRHTLRRLFLLLSFSIFCCVCLYAQENFTGINDSVINLSCNQACTGLKFKVPHLKTSEDYTVVPIPFRPYPMTTPTGNALNLNEDDVYTGVINLPFPICFYGASTPYDKVVVGSNGLLTFDVSNAGCFNAWRIDRPIPSAGNGAPCPDITGDRQSSYYPRAAIMGPFVDLDPTVKTAGQKIEWRVEGAAPFRRFVASWNNIAVYGNPSCATNSPSSFQIVINEATSVIEIFIAQQNCFPGGGSTHNAILGIQNWNRDKAVTPPGRNATEWTAQKEGFRFVPSGTTSRFVGAQLLDINGNLLQTASFAESDPGYMDITFPSRCFNQGSDQYIIRTTYRGDCNSATNVVINDTVTVNTGVIPVNYTVTSSGCAVPSGSITATVTGAPGVAGPYTYTLNPGNIVISSPDPTATFQHLPTGHYSLVVNGAGTCSKTIPDIEVTSSGTFDVPYTVNPPSCAGATNARITVNPPAGGGPYTYRVNGSLRPSNVITGLSGGGTYQIDITAGAGCSASVIATIPQGSGTLSGFATVTNTTCTGLSNGTVTLTPTSGSGPYQYSMDNVNWQSSNVFQNLAPGHYSGWIREGVCTSVAFPVTVDEGNGLVVTGTTTPASCQGVNNGTVTIVMQNGTAPFTVALNAGTVLTATGSSVTFNNVPAGSYNVMVTDANGCRTSAPGFSVNVGAGGGFTATSAITNVSCFNGSNGSIAVTPAGGSGPYTFSLNTGAPQSGAASFTFNNLAANTYAVLVRDAVGCTFNLNNLQLTQPDVLAIPAPAVQRPLCAGESNGTITVSPTGGTAPYTYSVNGGAFQATNTFKVAAGNYTVRVLDGKSCGATLNNIIVADPPVLSATIAATTNATCEGGADGSIEVTASGGSSGYQYSIDGTTFQTSNILRAKQGTYIVYVKDMNDCRVSVSNVIVGLTNTLTYTPQTDPAPVCEGTSILLQINSNATAYTWSSSQPAVISSPSLSGTAVQPKTNTVFTVNMQLGVCSAQDDVAVQVLAAPVADAGTGGEICFGQNYQLQGNGGVRYEWTPQRYLSDPYSSSPQVIGPERTTTYSLTVIDANQCRSLTPGQVTIRVIPPIRVNIAPADTVVYAGAQFQYRVNSIATNYSWTPVTGLSNPNIANPVMTAPSNDGAVVQFKLDASTDAGCKGEGFATVRVYKGPDVYVANAFSPNNDGKNDIFLPFPVGIRELGYFRVFNRWGQMMFSTKTLNQGWDGRFAGLEQPTGVYTWMIEAITQDGRKIAKKGTVTLVR